MKNTSTLVWIWLWAILMGNLNRIEKIKENKPSVWIIKIINPQFASIKYLEMLPMFWLRKKLESFLFTSAGSSAKWKVPVLLWSHLMHMWAWIPRTIYNAYSAFFSQWLFFPLSLRHLPFVRVARVMTNHPWRDAC